MGSFKLKYGNREVLGMVSDMNFMGLIESKGLSHHQTEKEVVLNALKNPIGSQRLKEIVVAGEKICIVISDITRAWQKMNFYLPYIIEELYKGGVRDEDITFLCATGSHRRQSREEHSKLLGEELYQRFKVIDHDCRDQKNMIHVGRTTYGTPVWINKIAMESDHIILTGAIVYHDLAGWSGGKKSILPGIASYESIMANHGLSLSKTIGGGIHLKVGCGIAAENPIHMDMLEAAAMVKPSFMFNVIMDEKGNIGQAVAGHYIEAHEIGRENVNEVDGVYIKGKADLIIVSAGGYPKDINLYQASKALSNAKEAVKKDGTIILLAQCIEGFGDAEVRDIIQNYKDNYSREVALRADYTIAKYTGFLISKIAEDYKVILVSELNPQSLESINIQITTTLEEALSIAKEKTKESLKTYIMPYGANTLPKLNDFL
ncbi:nickel-dependent lactate racemase family protein [Alkaliphilus serpentinus]|uniref:Nickel-dependent lactate racemase n=1 Tax=Alkaliphilus serpentinus TaxID=1482731 RepID=A0A833M8Y9_9FIRM|nr:nickel-dependent lactate racemase [Alkaliphilus serpentinus]KAB3526233.1 nickel-dependent lactate racemase [Alkaliphilus serpentinus]